MKSRIGLLSCIAAAIAAIFLNFVISADEGSATKPTQIHGKIAITASDDTRITAATITASDGTVYNIELDVPGEDLARVMFGQDVDIFGDIRAKDGNKWLKFAGFIDDTHTAAHELWRRTRCNACAFQKGRQYSAEPRDLIGAKAITGHFINYKQQFRSFSRDEKFLWLADDSLVYQIDLVAGQLVKTYDRSAGIGDGPLLEIASDGKTLWILSHTSAAALTIGQEKAVPLNKIQFRFARLLSTPAATWIIADSGTFRCKSPDAAPEEFPAIPTGKKIGDEVAKGLWTPGWKIDTALYITGPTALGNKLYAGSFMNVYELSDGAWTKVIEGGVQQQVGHDRLWAITASGLVEYDPAAKTSKVHLPKELAGGRPTGFLITDADAWMTAEPTPNAKADEFSGGGLAKMSLADSQWQCWTAIDGKDATHAVVQAGQDGNVWIASAQGQYQVLVAHPGMTYVKKTLFAASGFALHRWDAAKSAWLTVDLPSVNFEKRFICGQDGQGADCQIAPQTIESLCITSDRVFAATHLMPVGSFSGFWPCVNLVARNTDGQFKGRFEYHPEQINQQGEQPLVLNISNKGEMILCAVGHDDNLGFFMHEKQAWVVTEGCVARYDAQKDAWQKIAELGYNFYWRPTVVLDEGDTVFIGGDRGIVSRLDLKTGRCEMIGGLKNRKITQLARREDKLIIQGGQPVPGFLPAYGMGNVKLVDADAACWDGKALVAVDGIALAPAAPLRWRFKPIKEDPKQNPPFRREQLIGNMLWAPSEGESLVPRYYIKEVYAPTVLDFTQKGKRLWCSVFSGLWYGDVSVQETLR